MWATTTRRPSPYATDGQGRDGRQARRDARAPSGWADWRNVLDRFNAVDGYGGEYLPAPVSLNATTRPRKNLP